MAGSSSTASHGVTFGIELEILVPYLWSDQTDPAGDTDERRVIQLSEEGMESIEAFYATKDKVKFILRDFLRSHGVPVYDNGMQGASPPTQWSVGFDSTVRETKFKSYRFVGIEIRSPALLAEPGSFTEIKRVVNLLRANFRLRVNETAGFHVHVGMGAKKLPSRAVRRIAQFLWCADGMLSQLHPPERMLSQFCPSIRHSSHLARGRPNHWVQAEEQSVEMREFLGRTSHIAPAVDREDPAAVSDRLAILQQNPNSFPALDARPGISRLQRLPPIRNNPYQDEGARRRHQISWKRELTVLSRREFLEQELLHPHEVGMPRLEPEETCTSVRRGLQSLCQPEMYEDTTRAVHELSCHVGQRFNYNLLAYDIAASGDVELRMTVEFREAAGSLNPSWVVAWARICSRIVGFCLEAEEAEFVEMLMRVLEAELAFEANGESRYDVVDLVSDLNLPDEAKYVESTLMGDKTSFWFPCVLEGDPLKDPTSAEEIMIPPENGE